MPDRLSFSQIRDRHTDYVRRSAETAPAPTLIAEIQNFIEVIRLSGREIVDEDDREYLRSLLTFWGNWLYNQTRTYPNTNLEPFTAEAAAEYGRRTAQKMIEGRPPGEHQRNYLVIGGAILMGLLALALVGATFVVGMFNLSASAAEATEDSSLRETGVADDATMVAGLVASIVPTETRPSGGGGNGALATPAETATPLTFPETPTPAATHTAVSSPSPTARGSVNPTVPPPEVNGQGGGGEVQSPVGILSVQIIEPQSGALIEAGRPFTLSATYFNLQPGWKLFFVLRHFNFGLGNNLIFPESLAIEPDNPTGVVEIKASIDTPGFYAVGVYIATSSQEIARLQRWADSQQTIPPTLQYDGVILFPDLVTFRAGKGN